MDPVEATSGEMGLPTQPPAILDLQTPRDSKIRANLDAEVHSGKLMTPLCCFLPLCASHLPSRPPAAGRSHPPAPPVSPPIPQWLYFGDSEASRVNRTQGTRPVSL